MTTPGMSERANPVADGLPYFPVNDLAHATTFQAPAVSISIQRFVDWIV